MEKKVLVLMMILLALGTTPAMGQELMVFPAKGQTDEQVEKDKYSCYEWAVKQTGFDPAQPQPVAQAPQTQSHEPTGARLKGAARGAAIGAVTGEIAHDDAGHGAAAGAAAGTMAGGMKTRSARRNQEHTQQAQTQQHDAETTQKMNDFNRASSACLESKGYTVE